MTDIRKLKDNRQLITTLTLLSIILLMVIVFSSCTDTFLTQRNVTNLMRQTAETGMIVMTVGLLVLSRDIDVSMGSALGLCCVSLGLLLNAGVLIPLACLLVVVIGAVAGSFTGFLVAKLGLPGMVATTGVLIFLRGLCYVLTKGYPVSGFPDVFIEISRVRVFGFMPLSFLVLLVVVAITCIVMEKTNIGLQIMAMGSNKKTAYFSGIKVDRLKWLLFVANGAMIGLASIFLLSRMGSAEATTGQGYDLDILASCLLGGLSLHGGKGNIFTVFLGLLGIGIMRNGFNQLSIPSIYQEIVLGVLIAVNAANWAREKRH